MLSPNASVRELYLNFITGNCNDQRTLALLRSPRCDLPDIVSPDDSRSMDELRYFARQLHRFSKNLKRRRKRYSIFGKFMLKISK